MCLCQMSICSSSKQLEMFPLQQTYYSSAINAFLRQVFFGKKNDFESAPSKPPQKNLDGF